MAGRSAEREFRPYDPNTTLRNGYREPGEPGDGRPVIARGKFWATVSEQMHYEHTVQTHPRRSDEGAMSYITRIAEIVARRPLPPPVKDMPRLPYRDDSEDA
jgi:hypothetical protein